MRYLRIFALLFVPLLASAQVDIQVVSSGSLWSTPTAAWGSGGVGNMNNAYILTAQQGQTGVCILVKNNNPTNAHIFDMAVDITPDPTAIGFFANNSIWTSAMSTISLSSLRASAGQSITLYAPTAGATKIAIIILNSAALGGVPDTGSMSISPTFGGTFCGGTLGVVNPVFQGSPTISADPAGYVSVRRPIFCDQSVSVAVATATNVVLVANPTGGGTLFQKVHVCNYAITGAPSTSAAIIFATGTAGNCTALGTTLWQLTSGTTTSLNMALAAGGGGELFETNALSPQPLCVRDGGTTSGIQVSVSYAVFQ